MTSNPSERDVGTAAWRIDQARNELGFQTVRLFANYLGITVGTLNNYQREFESRTRRRRNAMATFRRMLPDAFADYIESGGSEMPPKAGRDWRKEVVDRNREADDYSHEWNDVADRPRPEPSPFEAAYATFRSDGMPWQAALISAMTAMESMGKKEIADRYRPVFMAFLQKEGGNVAMAAEECAGYKMIDCGKKNGPGGPDDGSGQKKIEGGE